MLIFFSPLISNIAADPLIQNNFQIWSVTAFIAQAIGWGLIIGAVLVFGCLVISGFQLATGGNDSGKTKNAKDQITNCLFGFGVLSSTYAITLVVQSFLGINIFQNTPYTPPGSVPYAGTCTQDSDCISPNLCIGGICQLELSRNCSDSCINDYGPGTYSSGLCTSDIIACTSSGGVWNIVPGFGACSSDGSSACCCTNNPSTVPPPEPTPTPTLPTVPTPTPTPTPNPNGFTEGYAINCSINSNILNLTAGWYSSVYNPTTNFTINIIYPDYSNTTINNYDLWLATSTNPYLTAIRINNLALTKPNASWIQISGTYTNQLGNQVSVIFVDAQIINDQCNYDYYTP